MINWKTGSLIGFEFNTGDKRLFENLSGKFENSELKKYAIDHYATHNQQKGLPARCVSKLSNG